MGSRLTEVAGLLVLPDLEKPNICELRGMSLSSLSVWGGKSQSRCRASEMPRTPGCRLLWAMKVVKGSQLGKSQPCEPLWSMGAAPRTVMRIGHGKTGSWKGPWGYDILSPGTKLDLAMGKGSVGVVPGSGMAPCRMDRYPGRARA